MTEIEVKTKLDRIEQLLDNHNNELRKEVSEQFNIFRSKFQSEVKDWYVALQDELKRTNERLSCLEKDVAPAVSVFNDAASARRVLVWGVGGLAAIGGLIIMFREIFIGR